MNKFKWIAALLVAVAIIIILAGIYKFNYKANQPGHDADGNKIETVQPAIEDKTN